MTTDPHHAEYAGAIAGMTETYGAWTPRVGDRVRAELPFRDTHGIGTVTAVTHTVVVVEIDGETLWYYPHDLEYAGN
jgi:hypothetical protein